jgi:DNA-binding MarR family transcriptional regulator
MLRVRSSSVKPLTAVEIAREKVDALFMVWLVSRSTQDLLDSALRPAGLTGDEYAIYSVLAAAPGITPTELARWMAAPATTVSSYLKRFEARGHVSRAPNPTDRRSHQIRLTPAGKRAHKAASALFAPVQSEVNRALADHMGAVQQALLRLRTILDNLRHGVEDHGRGSRAQELWAGRDV